MKHTKLVQAAGVAAAAASVAMVTISCGGGGAGTGGASGSGGGASQPLPGSGGTAAPQAASALTVAVKWPQRSVASGAHMIPDDSNSIQLLLVQNGSTIASTCLARPSGTGVTTSSYTFSNVPTGLLSVNVSAYPDEACSQSDPAQATGTAAVTVAPGVSQTVGVTLVGTVASASVTPSAPTVAVGGGPVTFTASALDGQGNTVLTAPGDWTWSCSPSVVVSPASGTGAQAVLTGAQVGQTVCTFTLLQGPGATAVTGSATIIVQPVPTPLPSPTPTPSPSPTPSPTPIPQYTLTTLAIFSGLNVDQFPDRSFAGLVTDGRGNLYGTMVVGGSSGYGTIFEWNASSGLTTLASFTGQNGVNPDAALVTDGTGNVYGTTGYGGIGFLPVDLTTGAGTIFKWNASSGLTALVSFDGTDESQPGNLITDGKGNFYGTTGVGGSANDGTLFKWNPSSGITTLASFSQSTPLPSSLITDGQGNFYGASGYGGSADEGTIIKWNASTGFTTLASFSGINEQSPAPLALVADGQGDLYGTTFHGGSSNLGTIFEWSAGSGLTTLVSFNGANGLEPEAGLITDGQGNFYGSTHGGGSSGLGTVFVWNASSGLTTLASFNGSNGQAPQAPLVEDGQGNLYGTTALGGSSGEGTIFELSPVTAQGAARRSAAAAARSPRP